MRSPDKKSYYSSKDFASSGKYRASTNRSKIPGQNAAKVFDMYNGGNVQNLKPVNLSGYDPIKVKGGTLKKTDTQTLQNKRMSQAVESARSEESLLDGKDRRKLERKAIGS